MVKYSMEIKKIFNLNSIEDLRIVSPSDDNL